MTTITTFRLAAGGARAHVGPLIGVSLVLALAATLLSATGVIVQSGADADGGFLATLAASFAGTTVMVVVLVVASSVTLALRRRRRELALLRAVGATRSQVRRLISTELTLVTAFAAPLGAVPGLALADRLTPWLVQEGIVPRGHALTVGPAPAISAVLLLLTVALLAAALATRETLRTPVTEAVRESLVEPGTVGRGRRVVALAMTVLGLTIALTPVVLSGVIGSAMAVTSTFLLVGATALAGPVLVAWCLRHDAVLRLFGHGAAGRLAVANTRGFSRRLTTAVLPLALVLAVGTVQTTTDRTLSEAAARELTAGLHADLVVPVDGASSDTLEAISRTPGVTASAPLASTTARVRTDPEDLPGLESILWEPAVLRVLPSDLQRMLDPSVVDGSLDDLARPGTVAASRDALLGTGIGIGDTVGLRLGSVESQARVVAVYERSLGFGDYLAGDATVRAHGLAAPVDTVLLRTDPGAPVAERLAAQGLPALDERRYARAADPDTGARQVSLILLFALLGFVGLAAANVLVMTTAGRRGELELLLRTGATRLQLLAMATLEALVAALVAWAIGTASVLPAVLGVGFGLLGTSGPRIDLAAYAILTLLVLAVTLLTIVPTVAAGLRTSRLRR
ncbi:FtsX-like permease family protein [Nocardioides sp. NPDC057772]|uniref:FtsX-like permease family protein n=1 Tax=Nocardioides sp. NPDC057772 TaxID=3346245 RepID=UPI003671E570